jgi:hypothetical protein
MRRRHIADTTVLARLTRSLALQAGCLVGLAVAAQAKCGEEAQVRPDDTLSSIAARCDVTERRILHLNPAIEGTKDLRVGMALKLSSETTGSTGTVYYLLR